MIAPGTKGLQIGILLKGPFEVAKALAVGPSFSGSYWGADRLIMFLVIPISAFLLVRAFFRADAVPALLALTGGTYAAGLWLLCGLGILPFWYAYHHSPVAPFFSLLLGIGLMKLTARSALPIFTMLVFVYGWGDLRLIKGVGGWNSDWPEAAATIRQRLSDPKSEIWLADGNYKPSLEFHVSEWPIHSYPYAYDFKRIARDGWIIDRPDPENSPLPTTPQIAVVSFRQPASFDTWIKRVDSLYGPPREKIFVGALQLSFYETGP